MAIEINLATYDKQEEILSNLGGGATFMYMLAKSDSTASQSDIESLKEIPHIKNIVNSEAAVRAVANSSIAMKAVINSSTALIAVANSSTAMEIVANSSTAMEAVLNSSTAMEAVANSSTAMEAVANSSTAMKAVANSSTAMEIVANSSTAMEAVANSSTAMNVVASSSTAMNALLNSKNTKTVKGKEISGRFLPLKASGTSPGYYRAYNGSWSDIGIVLGAWLKANSSNPVATKIKTESNDIYYYDLDA